MNNRLLRTIRLATSRGAVRQRTRGYQRPASDGRRARRALGFGFFLAALITLLPGCWQRSDQERVDTLEPCRDLEPWLEETTGVTWTIDLAVVQDPLTSESADGCLLLAATTWTDASTDYPAEDLRSQALELGWTEDLSYGADGPDGTAFRLMRSGVSCFVRGSWDGGDPSDLTYVPSDSLHLSVGCVRSANPDAAR